TRESMGFDLQPLTAMDRRLRGDDDGRRHHAGDHAQPGRFATPAVARMLATGLAMERMTMTRWNCPSGPRLAVLLLAFAAMLSAGCAHSTSPSNPTPAMEADAMTASGSHTATENPTLTAEEIGRRFLALIEGLESRDQLSLERIRHVMGIAIPHEPGALLAGVGSHDLGGGWRYVLNYVSESPSNARGVALSFVNEHET